MTKKVFMKQAFLNDFSTEKCTFIEQIMKNNSLESIHVKIYLILISLMMSCRYSLSCFHFITLPILFFKMRKST